MFTHNEGSTSTVGANISVANEPSYLCGIEQMVYDGFGIQMNSVNRGFHEELPTQATQTNQ